MFITKASSWIILYANYSVCKKMFFFLSCVGWISCRYAWVTLPKLKFSKKRICMTMRWGNIHWQPGIIILLHCVHFQRLFAFISWMKKLDFKLAVRVVSSLLISTVFVLKNLQKTWNMAISWPKTIIDFTHWSQASYVYKSLN